MLNISIDKKQVWKNDLINFWILKQNVKRQNDDRNKYFITLKPLIVQFIFIPVEIFFRNSSWKIHPIQKKYGAVK